MRKSNELSVEQQVWLAAWTAAVSSPGKYNPKEEAELCLSSFRERFITEAMPILKISDSVSE